jgi:hypothetical protein
MDSIIGNSAICDTHETSCLRATNIEFNAHCTVTRSIQTAVQIYRVYYTGLIQSISVQHNYLKYVDQFRTTFQLLSAQTINNLTIRSTALLTRHAFTITETFIHCHAQSHDQICICDGSRGRYTYSQSMYFDIQ